MDNFISIQTNKIVFYGIGKPKDLILPNEITEWIKKSKALNKILNILVNHQKFKKRLSNPMAIRSLLVYLYAKKNNIAPYIMAKKFNIAPEQLYRIERGLKKDNLYNTIMIEIDLDSLS
ncbi:hypothetical protein [Caldisphaera sp.]|uniref:hypothetical protein n=1 Tax=Caldisphaera sp. TaxID=2060322 RepID=UPI0025BEFEA4|nr:hypothetical protein [Caldisphaera sp.]